MFSCGELSCIWNFVSFIMFAGRPTQSVLMCFLILAFTEFFWFLLPEVCKIILNFLLVLLWIPTWIPQHFIILISHVNYCFLQLSFKESIRKIMLRLCRILSPKWRTIFSLTDKIATLSCFRANVVIRIFLVCLGFFVVLVWGIFWFCFLSW